MIYEILAFCILCSVANGASVENDDESDENSTEDSAYYSVYFRQLPENWLEVPLDHFNLFDNRTWKMRYFINDEFFEEGQPIFIEVGGEWTIDGYSLQQGQVYLLGKEHRGMLVETEHRYYGKSLPFDTNFTVENLKYLQIEQALEDLAYFIEHFKASDPKFAKSKVVIHGCSYPGMLVTWMRLRFPHVVDIAYASSAPLGVGLDYPEYFEIVNDVYANVSDDCIGTIREGFNEAAELLKTEKGRKKVDKALKKWNCGSMEEYKSIEILLAMRSILNVQSDPLKYEEISCLILSMDDDDDETTAFDRLANLVVLKSKDRGACDQDPDNAQEKNRTSVAWSYQTCTEMGTFQTLDRGNSRHPFGVDQGVDVSVQDCVDSFGGIVTEHVLRSGIERVTRRYGGKKPKVTKVVTVQGTHDPWKHLAHLGDYTKEAPVYIVNGFHCVDVTERADDPDYLIEFRKMIRDVVSKWITELP